MTSPIQLLAVDSDGCVIDSMTEKHLQCFTPALIETWKLQNVSETATRIALDINLYSDTRGVNRFVALAMFFEKLKTALGEDTKGINLPDIKPLRQWLARTNALSENSLTEALGKNPAPILVQAIEWSRNVNRRVKALQPGKPFPEAVATLREANQRGIAIHVVSSANRAALEAEWGDAGLLEIVSRLGSQEEGSKTTLLREAVENFGHSAVLMVGDAMGDADAARAAGVAYFPIKAGAENESWVELRKQLFQ